jgi:hypothetical protein
MRKRFPRFQLRRDANGNLYWTGIVEPLEGHLFRIAVRYPSHYPYREPQFHVVEPPLRHGAPHVYMDGSLCLHRVRWNPDTGTAASCVPLISGWLVGYVSWCQTGESF